MAKKKYIETEAYEKGKRDLSRKNFRFARFMMLRYAMAFFFFTNLYWFAILLEGGTGFAFALPLGLLVLSVPAIYEQMRLYGDKSNDLTQRLEYNRYYYWGQIAVNLGMLGVLASGALFHSFFPIFNGQLTTRLILGILPLLGLLLARVCLTRIHNIKNNTDKFYARQQAFESAS